MTSEELRTKGKNSCLELKSSYYVSSVRRSRSLSQKKKEKEKFREEVEDTQEFDD